MLRTKAGQSSKVLHTTPDGGHACVGDVAIVPAPPVALLLPAAIANAKTTIAMLSLARYAKPSQRQVAFMRMTADY